MSVTIETSVESFTRGDRILSGAEVLTIDETRVDRDGRIGLLVGGRWRNYHASDTLTGVYDLEASGPAPLKCPECGHELMPPAPAGEPGDDSHYCEGCGAAWSLDLSRRLP